MKLKKIYKKYDYIIVQELTGKFTLSSRNYKFYDFIYDNNDYVPQLQFNTFLYNKYRDFSFFYKDIYCYGVFDKIPKEKDRNATDWSNYFDMLWTSYINHYGRELDNIVNALLEEYAPLDNYDKYSTITTTDNDRTETTLGKVTSHMGGTSTSSDGTTTTTEQGDEKTTTTTPSFDVDSTKKTETTTEYSATSPRTTTVTPNTTTTTTQVANDNSYTDYGENGLANVKNGSTTVEEHTYGNIGVTTSSKMLEEYVLTRIRYSLWEFIAETYADMFLYLK